MEKTEKQLHLWIHAMMTHKQSRVEGTLVRLKAKEIYGCITHGQENVTPLLASVVLADSHIPKDNMACKMLNL